MKDNIMKVLNGLSIGVVIALMPSAIFSQIFIALEMPDIASMLNISTSLMCLSIGLAIAYQFKLDLIPAAVLAIATMISGQAIQYNNEILTISGTGDIINATFGAAIALLLIKVLDNKLGMYKLIILPAIIILIVGTITMYSAQPIFQITEYIGNLILHFTTLKPILMCTLIGISFGIIIVSPISSVAIALLINLSGVGAAAASVGICAVAISLAISSFKSNGLASSIAIFLGSPKLQMANFIRRPLILLPGIIGAAISSPFAVIFNLQGTTLSAGFGSSGLIGPITNLNINGYDSNTILITIIAYLIIPFVSSLIAIIIINKTTTFIKSEYYKIHI